MIPIILLLLIFHSGLLSFSDFHKMVILALLLIFYSIRNYFSRNQSISHHSIVYWSLATVAFFVFGYVLSVDRISSYYSFINSVLAFSLVLLIPIDRDEKKHFSVGVVVVTFMLLIISLAIRLNLLPPPIDFLQFSHPLLGQHNHWGDMAGLTLIILIHAALRQSSRFTSLYWILLMVLVPFFLFSYSRSALIAVAAAIIYALIFTPGYFHNRKLPLLLLAIVLFVFGASLHAILNTIRPETGYRTLVQKVMMIDEIPYKNPLGSRDVYFRQAISTILRRPLGYGLNTYHIAAEPFQTSYQSISASSHNVFLDWAVELGIPTTLVLVMAILTCCYSIIKRRAWQSIFIIYMVVLFQFDYIFKATILFALFLRLLVCEAYQSKTDCPNKTSSILPIFIPLLPLFIILTSHLALYIMDSHQFIRTSVVHLNPTLTQQLIESDMFHSDALKTVLQNNENNILVLAAGANAYRRVDNREKELSLLYRIFLKKKYPSFSISARIYDILSQQEGRVRAERFFAEAVARYKGLEPWRKYEIYDREIKLFCEKKQIQNCRSLVFNE